jgi:CheY-like chemotaxis protein
VAKILVADDNSNIQKMVGLALKDHGIEVLAVGNGEAAVRKISDVRPDLVLADVFMPVRNGYEVCSYVKEDKALAHIPVILLVGAFDPLDEQEAQRVGADGVLKKPFVPPDPLISMVKSALVRAGVAHTGFSPAKPAAETAPEPPAPAPPRPSVPVIEVMPKLFDPQAETESFVDEIPVAPVALKIEPGQQPVAFGSLLEAPASEAKEDPEEMTAPAGMGMERDWRSAPQDEEEEEETSRNSWRRDGAEESFVEEREAASASSASRTRHHEPWTPTREKSDLTEASEPETVESVPVGMLDRRDLPSGSPFAGEAWAAALDTHSDRKTAVAEAEHPEMHAADLERLVGHAPEPEIAEERAAEQSVEEERAGQAILPEEPVEEVRQAAVEPETVSELPKVAAEPESGPEQPAPLETSESAPSPAPASSTSLSTASSWFSNPPSPWEAEAQKASQLASSWDALIPPPSDLTARGDVTFEPPVAPDEIEIVAGTRLRSEVSAAAVETVRDETAQAVEQHAQQATEANSPTDAGQTAQENAAATAIDMDAVVAKVFARLSPGVLEGVTRDILKPLVEAVVREELASKKS